MCAATVFTATVNTLAVLMVVMVALDIRIEAELAFEISFDSLVTWDKFCCHFTFVIDFQNNRNIIIKINSDRFLVIICFVNQISKHL